MIWPFKKTKKITLEEYAATQPIPPCGEPVEHWEWILQIGMSCPMCDGKKRKEQEEIDENRMAEKIAAAVVKILDQRTTGKEMNE